MRLYELTSEFNELYDMLDDEDMDPEAWFDTLDGIEQEIEDKVENIAVLIKNMAAESKAMAEEEKRLHDRRKSLDNRMDSLKNYLEGAMAQTKLDKVKGIRANVTRCKGQESVSIPDEDSFISRLDAELLQELVTEKTELLIDKKKVKVLLQNGAELKGAELIRKPYVLIK